MKGVAVPGLPEVRWVVRAVSMASPLTLRMAPVAQGSVASRAWTTWLVWLSGGMKKTSWRACGLPYSMTRR